jgi:RND family efflux transporter MFP subunit
VKAGDPLFIIDQRELQAQLIKDRAQLEIEEAELQRAKHQRARTAALVASQGVSQEEAQNRDDEFALREARTKAAYVAAKATESLLARLTIRAPVDGTILQVNVREGEYLAPGSATPPILLGAIDEVQVRADVDEQIAPRVRADSKATGYLKGDTQHPIPLEFVRIEPFVTPKRNLTGSSSERVDTRVLQVIYKFPDPVSRRIYVGQQMDLFIEE